MCPFSRNQIFQVRNHDFTKFRLILSVSLVVDIPSGVTGSWYNGQVLLGFAFKSSSPLRYVAKFHPAMAECNLLEKNLYRDGGSDH